MHKFYWGSRRYEGYEDRGEHYSGYSGVYTLPGNSQAPVVINSTPCRVQVNNKQCGVQVNNNNSRVQVNNFHSRVQVNNNHSIVQVNNNQYEGQGQTTPVQKKKDPTQSRAGVNNSQHGVQVIISKDSSTLYQGRGGQTVIRLVGEDKRGDAHGTGTRSRREGEKGMQNTHTVSRYQRNKTWDENTLLQAQKACGMKHERFNGKRQTVQNINFSTHNYENVYDNSSDIITNRVHNLNKDIEEKIPKSNTPHRQTPRSRKKQKALTPSQRSRSCERLGMGATLLDNLSCISKSGRSSPTENVRNQEEYSQKQFQFFQDQASPAQSLAHRLRGRLEYVNRKMNQIRSRSAERLRGCTSGVKSEVVTSRQVYSGPVIGQARAVVDSGPGPHDKDALSYAKDDVIDIIAMNASGLWRGRCGDRVGHFKFINVEILPPRQGRGNGSRRMSRRKPGTLAEVMRILNMEEHVPIFVLNGYEDLTLFKDLDNEELDYLGITNAEQREKLKAMTELLFLDTKDKLDDDKDDEYDLSSEASVADHSDSSISCSTVNT